MTQFCSATAFPGVSRTVNRAKVSLPGGSTSVPLSPGTPRAPPTIGFKASREGSILTQQGCNFLSDDH